MSDFKVQIRIIDSVKKHENADRLTIIKIGGYECIANLTDEGEFRYNQGDAVVYIPEGALLPEWLLRRLDMWNEEENKGYLAGSQGNRVKAIKLRGIVSQGVLYPVYGRFEPPCADEYGQTPHLYVDVENDAKDMYGNFVFENGIESLGVEFDRDYAELFGILKYEPPIPVHMAGEVMALFGVPTKYDFENLKSVPDIFDDTDFVIATEKLHGCVHGDSLVMLPDGAQETIKNIAIGYNVLSYDIANNKYINREVTGKMQRHNTENKKWLKIKLEKNELILTEDHPVYSRDRKQWIKAKDIKTNEDIESPMV